MSLFVVFPVFQAVYMSLFDWDLLALDFRTFIGLGNYQEMFNDSIFWSSFWNTVQFVILSTPSIVGVALLLAILLNGAGRGMGVFRTIFFSPYVFSVAVVTLIWAFSAQSPNRTVGLHF